MKKIKILELLPDIGSGGAERLVLDIVKNLDKEKYDVLLVSLFSKEHSASINHDFITRENIRVIFFDKHLGLDLSTVSNLMRLLKKERPDIIHTHLYSVIYALLPALLYRIPVRVHTVHSIADKELPSLYQKIMNVAYRQGCFTPIAISSFVRDSIQQRYTLLENAVPQIDNGIDIGRFAPSKEAPEAHSGIHFINVARFSTVKNHRLLIEAFHLVKNKEPLAELILVGDGELREPLEQQIADCGLTDSVQLVGVVSDVEKWLNDSDVFVLSSDYEGLPLSVMEAMATGLPVITTRAGGVADAVTDGEDGYIVDVGNVEQLAAKMLELAQNDDTRHRMADAALRNSKRFDIRTMVRHYEELFEKKLAERK